MKLVNHLSALAIVSVLILLIYAATQQTYRTGANDPQMQLIGDLKAKLEAGKPIESYFKGDTVDLLSSLSVFIETYDREGKPIESSGLINNALPVLPAGVLSVAKSNNENWVTWQPQQDVRLAMGVTKVNAAPIAYLAVGRSLREVENRTAKLRQMILVAWATCLIIIVFQFIVQWYLSKPKNIVKQEEQPAAI